MIDRFHFSLIVFFVFFCFRVLSLLPFKFYKHIVVGKEQGNKTKKNMKNRCLPLCLAMCLPFCLAMCLPAVFYGIKMLPLLFIFLPSIKPSAGSISVHDKVLSIFSVIIIINRKTFITRYIYFFQIDESRFFFPNEFII